ncbi:nucleotide exchange factor GrpE [Alteromonas sp. CYL-A6]|uniref:nucleotide exchange factor GrpE n=1 Tax=Alteromonas nitratireducens TaxID=3390813 RepID=UPI0034AD2607
MSDERNAPHQNDNNDDAKLKDTNVAAESETADNVDTSAEQAPADETAQRIYELETALSEAHSTIKEQQDSVLRARAEMENARRRADSEVEKARKFALERFAGELLPVLDNLERALEMADADNDAVKPLLEGVDMTRKTFLSTIEKFGLTPINPQGEAFNPDLHQAMSMQESADHEPNSVMAVMQKGYQLNGRLLRPAMVMVARAPESGVDTKA